MSYSGTPTVYGEQQLAAAYTTGVRQPVVSIAVGDGNGAAVTPTESQTALVHEVWRGPITSWGVDPADTRRIVVQTTIPATAGPFTVREAGVYDQSGNLVCVTALAATEVVAPGSGNQSTTIDLTIAMPIGSAGALTVSPTQGERFTIERLYRTPFISINSASTAAPPASPSIGDLYIVPAGATGAWATAILGTIAEWNGTFWAFLTPPLKMVAGIMDVTDDGGPGEYLKWSGTAWEAFQPGMRVSNGNPNGKVAGTSGSFAANQPPTFCWDFVGEVIWVCVVGGNAAAAQWMQATYQQFIQAGSLSVAATGSDATGTGTPGNPFLTVQKALNYAQSTFNLAGLALSILVGAGTFAGAILSGPINGTVSPGSVRIVGAGSGSTSIAGAGAGANAILGVNGTQLTVSGVKLTSGSQYALNAQGGSNISIGFDVNFGSCGAGHIYSDTSGLVQNNGGASAYTISGDAPYHVNSVVGGRINIVNNTITLSGSRTFSGAFVNAASGADLNMNGLTFSGPAATGVRCLCASNAVVNTAGGGSNYFPGNATSAPTTGGQVI